MHLNKATLPLKFPRVKAAQVMRMRGKRWSHHQARRRVSAKKNSQLYAILKAFKRMQVMRRTFPRQYGNDASKTEKKAKQ
jgi:hypothetical protein